MRRWATISDCGRYRYELGRRWDDGPDLLGFVMLNPSTADAQVDDATIRRCIRFGVDMGFAGIVVANLFAFRATDPRELHLAMDPIGPDNISALMGLGRECQRLILAGWGAHAKHPRFRRHAAFVRTLLPGMKALGLTKTGEPRHPLYLPATSRPTALVEVAP